MLTKYLTGNKTLHYCFN